jgi:hypothetical protein
MSLLGQDRIRIDPLGRNEAVDGCGTCFYAPTKAVSNVPQLLARDDENGEYRIRINGVLHRLKVVKERVTKKASRKSGLGEHRELFCKDSELSLTLKTKIQAVGYENTHYVGEIEIQKGQSSTKIKVEGDSGC